MCLCYQTTESRDLFYTIVRGFPTKEAEDAILASEAALVSTDLMAAAAFDFNVERHGRQPFHVSK